MRRTPLLALLLALFALVAACSDEEEGLSDKEQEYADAIASDMTDEDGMGVTDEEADCMAEAVMGEVGSEPFEEADVTPEDLAGDETPGQLLGEGTISDEQAGSIADTWLECADLPASLASSLSENLELDDEAVACVEEGLADGDVVRDYLMVSFTSDEEPGPDSEEFSKVLSILTDCSANEDGTGGPIVDAIADSIAADGTVTPEQAQCVAQAVVDEIGVDNLMQAGGSPSPELQQQMTQAVTSAAEGCGVPLEALAGTAG